MAWWWFALPLYSTWMFCQIAVSRLLLDIKTSQKILEIRLEDLSKKAESGVPVIDVQGIHLQGMHMHALQLQALNSNPVAKTGRHQKEEGNINTSTMTISNINTNDNTTSNSNTNRSGNSKVQHVMHFNSTGATGAGASAEDINMEDMSKKRGMQTIGVTGGEDNDLDLDIESDREMTMSIEGVSSRSRFGWWIRRRRSGALHINVQTRWDGDERGERSRTDAGDAGDAGNTGNAAAAGAGAGAGVGGLQVSRLGRFDHWI
jgi:hypothetical protein